MAYALDASMRHALFVVREGASTRKILIPQQWPTATVASPDQLLQCVEKAITQKNRLIMVVGEEEFEKTYQLAKLRIDKEKFVSYGFVVISKFPSDFFKKSNLPAQVLDVMTEKEFKRDTEFHLIRAFRHLTHLETANSKRIGPETLERLNQIFISLSSERNPEKLLSQILLKAMEITNAEGGTLYMADEIDGEMYFRLKISSIGNTQVTFHRETVRFIENSICGYVALTGRLFNIPELSTLKPLTLPQYNKQYDHDQMGNTVSMLTVPLKNSRYECVAVLQLVNKRIESGTPDNFEVRPFEIEDESLLTSFGTQAAVCLDNVDLYADIQRLFEGFVKAAITAIESRDPSTGGHSERVAKMSVALARATTECESGIYRSVKFKEEEIRELEYAALLHDFGKIGVREEVLVKAKKLYSYQLEGIQERIKICKAAAKINSLERHLQNGKFDESFERDYNNRVRQVEGYWDIILLANEPTIQKRENLEMLERIRSEQLLLPDGSHIALLSDDEYKALSVTRGSLTESERLEIESHVRHTHQFLKMIPWTKDFKHLTEIAYCHHEKLDGTGYPRGLSSHEIPLQSKIMTIADIFDALTAADRWYKEAVPVEKAIEILAMEVDEGKLDPVLYQLFVERRVYEVTHPKINNKSVA